MLKYLFTIAVSDQPILFLNLYKKHFMDKLKKLKKMKYFEIKN
jgi:hypothetical protein